MKFREVCKKLVDYLSHYTDTTSYGKGSRMMNIISTACNEYIYQPLNMGDVLCLRGFRHQDEEITQQCRRRRLSQGISDAQ